MIKPNGSKHWVFRYKKPYCDNRTTIKVGNYPSTSIKEAQIIRDQYKQLLDKDIDPLLERRQYKEEAISTKSNTLIVVFDNWMKVKKTRVSAGYANDIQRAFDNHIFPRLGKIPVSEITAPLAIETIGKVANQGKLELTRRLSQRLNEVMRYSLHTGLITHNPITGIGERFPKHTKKHNPTIKPEEIPQLLKNLSIANIRHLTKLLTLWQLHTITRSGEACEAKWSEIDLDEAIWNIPLHRMKNKKVHAVPLSPICIRILEKARQLSGNSEYVFPNQSDPTRPASRATVNMGLKRNGYKGKLTAHGMRSLASTTLNEQQFNPDVIEAALAHVQGNQVRAAYNRATYLEPRKELMNWWSNHLESNYKSTIDHHH